MEVLARGPVHEAFASTAEVPTGGGPVVDKRPPDPVEELPPDQKPDGDNVQWIPGYWHWEDERKDFIWISGFWRAAPSGRVWVPGGWQEVRGGFQWVAGFWNVATPGVRQADIEYLPPPPPTLETGPAITAPGDDFFYTPGCWVYRVNRYVWRPGFWVEHRPNWCWVPDHYRWTPCGYVFVPGFWDCPLERRGVLFAPVFFRPPVFARPRFVFTPVYAVPAPCLHTALFVRRGVGNYFFGDYFEQRYVTAGFTSWAGAGFRGTNFAVTAGVGRGFTYDPLWSFYSLNFRNDPRWQQNIASVYAGRFNGDVPRPPRTLVQQNTVVNNVTNNTNVIVNNNSGNRAVNTSPVAAPVMLASLGDLKKAAPTVTLKQVQAEDRATEQKLARELRQVAAERRKAETQLVNSGAVVAKLDDKPRQAKVELPKAVVARAQMPTDPVKAPPPPAAPGQKKADPPIRIPPAAGGPTVKPTVPQGTPGVPQIDPAQAVDPRRLPKVDLPKVGVPTQPPVTPVPAVPKTDPKPITDPARPVEPLKPVNPKKFDPPNVDPKPVVPVTPVAPPNAVELPRPEPKPRVNPAPPTVPLPTPVIPPNREPNRIERPMAVELPKPVNVPPGVNAKPQPKPEPPKGVVPPGKGEPKPITVPTPPAQPRTVSVPAVSPKPAPAPPKVDPPKPAPIPPAPPPTGSAGKSNPSRRTEPPKEDKKK